ncbi:hypothetical protein AAC387_Pa03g0526 [Persea americana]
MPTIEDLDKLYAKVMKGEWGDVVKMYEENKQIFQTAIITVSNQTALHIAISNSQTDVVKTLLDNIDALAIRKMSDNREENPLHLAASMGHFETCKLLVDKDPELIGAKNVEGETPLFLAVLHGKKEAFYALHPKCLITGKDIKHAKAHCERKDGDTILHVSIRGEYFELAYQIIHWYPELIEEFNEVGQTALHLLVQNPSAFRSGCYLGPVDDFIYSCLIVDLDKVELVETPSDFKVKLRSDIDFPVPGNYKTWLDLGKRVFILLVSWARAWKDIKSDICKIFSSNVDRLPVKNTIPGERQETSNRDPIRDEMSHDSSKRCQRQHIGDETEPQMGPRIEEGSGVSIPQEGHSRVESQMAPQRVSQMAKEDSTTERPQYPSNYHVFLHFLQFAIELFLFVIGLGYFQVHKIKAMKQKHKLTYHIMKKLIRDTKLWVYGRTGMRPPKESNELPKDEPHEHSIEPDEHSTKDQDEIHQIVSASTSNNPPRPDGLKDGKECKEMEPIRKLNELVEPIRELNELVKKIVSGLQQKEVLVEAEKKWSDVYRFKMPKDSVGDGKYISPILVAAKNGVVEIVKEILNAYSVAIYDVDADKKNVLMLAVENRQLDIYNILRQEYSNQTIIFHKSDNDGNSAIHLAATTGPNQPWPIPGAALQMQWELKWYEFVRETMPHNIFTTHRNKEGMTSTEVFNEAHKTMLKDGVQWLTNTAQSCSVVAALVATVAYASATTVPGGVEKGIPLLRNTCILHLHHLFTCRPVLIGHLPDHVLIHPHLSQ